MSCIIKAIETVYDGYRFRSKLEATWAVFFNALGVEYEYEPEGFVLPDGSKYLPDFRVKCWGTRGQIKERCTADDGNLCGNCKYGHGDPYAYEGDCTNENVERYDGFVTCAKGDSKANNTCCKCAGFELDDSIPFDLYIEVKGRMSAKDARKIVEFSRCYPILVVGDIPKHGLLFPDNEEYYMGMDGTEACSFSYRHIDGDYFPACPAASSDGRFYLFGGDSNYIRFKDAERVRAAYDKARQARFDHGERP